MTTRDLAGQEIRVGSQVAHFSTQSTVVQFGTVTALDPGRNQISVAVERVSYNITDPQPYVHSREITVMRRRCIVIQDAKELAALKRDSEWLGYLESAGVDNWPGYSHAHDLRREARRENRGEPLHG